MPDDDKRQRLIEAILGPQQPLNNRDLNAYMARTPDLREPWLAGAGQSQPMPPIDPQDQQRIIAEATALANPFGISGLQRLFGIDLPGNLRVNEAHGIANKERTRLLDPRAR